MVVVVDRVLPISGCDSTGSHHRLSSMQIFVERETECTSEMARGQFSIFGAIEENAGRGL